MKYIALLSGGKDSCYNLVHCARNGHELIAAGSLAPAEGKEEIDSYMYQTVGQDAVQFVAHALDVPLYRQIISGDAVEQGLEYGARDTHDAGAIKGDETEDLYELLATSAHPEIQGVSVGAILSNYQRVRVEHVCRRLDLTPLCFLWQRDQGELLAEMIDAGLEAILIKVAGIGLMEKHLGKTLGEMQPTFIKLNAAYGAHICGEGGEYETLTLDCPLFKSRIDLTEVETVIHSESSFAPVAYLRIKGARLVPKEGVPDSDHDASINLEEPFQKLNDMILQSQKLPVSTMGHMSSTIHLVPKIHVVSRELNSWVAISNVQSQQADVGAIEDEVRECFRILKDKLFNHDLQLSHCTNINLFISSIDLFARINAVYATFFGSSPPARACVAVDLPGSTRVRLECVAYKEKTSRERQALHVQSLSYWAPANIGPYSQSVTIDQRVFISGQIGMIPSSLGLPSPPSLALETALSSQHVSRVTEVLRSGSGGGWTGHTQSTIYWLQDVSNIPHVRSACANDTKSPTLFLVVKSLPKNALVEKQVLLHTGRCYVKQDDFDDEMVWEQRPALYTAGGDDSLYWETTRFADNQASCTLICARGPQNDLATRIESIPDFAGLWSKTLCIRLFYSAFKELSTLPSNVLNTIPTTLVPCRMISTREADNWDYAMCIMGS